MPTPDINFRLDRRPPLRRGFHSIPFTDLPQLAKKYQDLNKDVIAATNKKRVDGPESEADHENCYSPAESLAKEKLSRDEMTKVAG